MNTYSMIEKIIEKYKNKEDIIHKVRTNDSKSYNIISELDSLFETNNLDKRILLIPINSLSTKVNIIWRENGVNNEFQFILSK